MPKLMPSTFQLAATMKATGHARSSLPTRTAKIGAALELIVARLNDVLEAGWSWIFQLLATVKPMRNMLGVRCGIKGHRFKGLRGYVALLGSLLCHEMAAV